MSKVGESHEFKDTFDIEDCARWNFYCSAKEVLTQEAYMKYFGNGDFDSFNEAVDGMNSRGA